ncbi:MAG: hypothetical protein IKS00_05650 [Bacteroidales bacterium]|nr:hypothetical protein [Bacteroidales bacterium]
MKSQTTPPPILAAQNKTKEYHKPEFEVIDLNIQSPLLSGSGKPASQKAANAAVTSQALGISKPADEVAPGTIYTVDRYFTPRAFSVSATKKVYFSSGNLQYNPAQGKWQFAAHQYDICIKADNNDVSSMYNKDYDGWIDLFGWGTWLNGADVLKPYETQTDDYTKYKWSGNSAIGSEWTTLSKDEWIYLLGDYEYNKLAQFSFPLLVYAPVRLSTT